MAILVANDFSPEARTVCDVAADLARALGMPMTIVHVLEQATSFPLDLDHATANVELERLHATKKLLEIDRKRVESSGVTVTTDILHGFVQDALAAYARRHHVQLVVAGAGGDYGTARGLSENLAENMPCPVMIVRPIVDRLHLALSGKWRLRVAIAVDRTRASDAPIAWVKALRERIPCDLFVHHFYNPEAEHRRLGIPLGGEPFVPHPQVITALERELRQRCSGLRGEGDLTVRCRPHFGSVSVEAICSARVDDADFIVVGTHRRRGVSRLVHGSVSRDIIRHSEVPVVCVGPDSQASHHHGKIHKVLAATDLTDIGNRAVAYAYDLLADGGGTVDIIYVATHVTDIAAQLPGEAGRLTAAQREQLVDALQRLIPEDIDPAAVSTRCIVVDGGPASDAILQAAARASVDAICLASRGRGPFERALTGSVATEVTQGAHCPVLVVRDIAA